MGIIQNVINKVKSMINSKDIPVLLESRGELYNKQKLWKDMYLNKSPWLSKTIKSLNLAAAIAAEVSRLITLEIESEISNDEQIDTIYQREIMRDLRTQVEYGLALGGLIMKPYVINGTVRVDFAQPTDFQILKSSSDGTILEILFKDHTCFKDNYYMRIEHHKFDEITGNYYIDNRVFKSDDKGSIGSEINDYTFIEPWANIEREFQLINIKAPLFGYFKPAISNNIDTKSTLGISIYSRAVEAIQRADETLSGMLREFKVKEAKQYVSSLAVKGLNQPLPYLEDDYYIKLNVAGGKSGQGDDFFESYSPEIFVEKFLVALNEFKREIEDLIGLAHGTFSDPEAVAKTATEMKMSKQRTYVLITENQKNLQDCLESAVYAMSVWLKYPSIPPEYEIITDFDDSILTDWETELMGMLNDVSSGLLRPEIYIAKKYGVSEEEALKMMPESTQLGI